tara:strand:- start:75 stop:1064 length:990 start_codon:yes stop_codon:yes gene_type:complete
MKLELNFKSLTILFLLTCVTLITISTALNAKPTASHNPLERNDEKCAGGAILDRITDKTDCETTPDIQKVTWYRLDLCTSEPTSPTLTATVDRTNCSTFYKNDSGSEVSIINGSGTQIGSAADYTALPYGTYTHGVVTMGSTFKFTNVVTFSGTMGDGSSTDSARCVTQTSSLGTIYGYESNRLNTQAKRNIVCDDDEVASETTVGVNTLTTDSNDNCYHLVTFKGTNRNIDGYLLESDGTLQGDVELNNDNNILDRAGDGDTGCTAGTSNEITRIQGIMPMNLKITPETSGLQIRYNNTRGIKVDMSSTNNVIFKWDSAFFDFELIAK